MIHEFGKPSGEGMRFVQSEIKYLAKISPYLIPSALLHTMSKFLGYKVGYNSQRRESRPVIAAA